MSRSLNISINDPGDKERYLKCMQKLSKVLARVQSDEYSVKGKTNEKLQNVLLDDIQKIFNEVGLKIFCETLFRMMVVPFQSKDNPHIVRLINFFFAIICNSAWDQDVGSQQSPNETVNSINSSIFENGVAESMPVRILRLCERYHDEERALVRLRVMQTVAKIIPERVKITEMRKAIQAKMVKMLLTRIKDKNEQVRAWSVRTLNEFYDVEGVPYMTQIADAIINSMRYDPEHCVRIKILTCIKITDETLEHVVERAGDPNTNVRTAALRRISENIKLTDLTIEMREAILKANITEDAPKSIEKAIIELLESWMKSLQNDICEFLRVLNVRKRSNLCQKALDTLYNQLPEEAYEKMSSGILCDKRYPDDALCIESTFLWLYLYRRFKDEQYIYNKLALPVCEMIEYINEYIEVVEEEGDLPLGDLEYRSWMLGDLLQVLAFLPIEEGERRAILEYLSTLCSKKTLMDERNCALVIKLISVCSNIHDENTLVELVNSLMDSDRPSIRRSNSTRPSALHSMKTEEEVLESTKPLKIELGNLMHRRKKLERDREIAINENDLYKAQACQDQIVALEAEIESTKEAIQNQASMNETVVESNETLVEEEEPWTYSNKTMLIVLSLVKYNIQLRDKISDFCRTFYEMYAVKAVCKAKDPNVRALALELMCIVALDFEQECARSASYCLQALLRDALNVKISALKCLYDLVLRYSFAKIGDFQQVQTVLMGNIAVNDAPKIQINSDDPASTLKTLLLSYVRHEEVRLVKVSVAGVLKLLFKKEMGNSRIITTFLLNWAIPSQDAQIRFKEVGTMIPVYANLGENESIEVADCLIQFIKKAILKMHSRAPGDEQTPHPDIDKVITLVVKCTDPSRLTEFRRFYIAQETIANGALLELQKSGLTSEERLIYSKLLKVLDIRQCPPESITQMLHTLADIIDVSNKTVRQILQQFSSHLESLLEKKGGLMAAPENGVETEMAENTANVPPGAFDNDTDEETINADSN